MKVGTLLRRVALASCCVAPAARAATIATRVEALDGKSCNVYLHLPSEPADANMLLPALPLVLSQQGTGIYSTADEVEPALRPLLNERRIAVLTIDKPGISRDPAAPGKIAVKDELYNRYTQGDLVACLGKALIWAMDESDVPLKPSLYFSGHSEGAQVMTRLYLTLAQTRPELAKAVRVLFLSGLPMDDWREMLDSQLSSHQRERFWAGFERGDNSILRSFGGLTFFYLKAVFTQEPLRKSLAAIRELSQTLRVRVFQGLRDRNTKAESVIAFEKENDRRRGLGLPSLDFKARYYEAGHGLNRQAITDIVGDLSAELVAKAAVTPRLN